MAEHKRTLDRTYVCGGRFMGPGEVTLSDVELEHLKSVGAVPADEEPSPEAVKSTDAPPRTPPARTPRATGLPAPIVPPVTTTATTTTPDATTGTSDGEGDGGTEGGSSSGEEGSGEVEDEGHTEEEAGTTGRRATARRVSHE